MGFLEERLAQAEAFAGKGYEKCKYGKYRDALDLFRQASDLDPMNYKYWYNAAVACDRIGDLGGMERAAQKTIECDGTFIKGYVRLAKALVRQQKYDAAKEYIDTGLLVGEDNVELKDLKVEVLKKLEEKSMIEARRLADQLRKADPAKNSATSGATASSAASNSSLAGRKPAPRATSPVRNSLSGAIPISSPKKPDHVDKRRSSTPAGRGGGGGIPANQREIPRLNNQFGDSGPQQQNRASTAKSPPPASQQQRDANFYGSDGNPRPPKIGQPIAASRPYIPPNRANGPDYKDQCKTFIVDDTAVQPMDPTSTTETIANHKNNNNNKSHQQQHHHAEQAPKKRLTGQFMLEALVGRRKNNEEDRNMEL